MLLYNREIAEQTWSAHFTFAKVRASEWGYKEKLWKESTHGIAKQLAESKNVGVRLGTGGGKTIIALLAADALHARTLFLTPTRYLAKQHDTLLHEILGCSLSSRVITGETSPRARIWTYEHERFIFATGAVFSRALSAGTVSADDFTLVIIDEFHRARGQYDYVSIVPEFVSRNVPRLALSASPGETREEIEFTLKNAGIERLMSPLVEVQPISEEHQFVALTPEMERADREGWQVLGEKIRLDLWDAGLRIPQNWRYPARDLAALRAKIHALPTTKRNKLLRMQFAKYRLYLYAHYAYMACSYSAFLAFVLKLMERKRPSDRMLLGEPLFRRLIATARQYQDAHPKVIKLERMLRTLQASHKRAVVFFADKVTAQYWKQLLDTRGIRTEVAFGGRRKNHDVLDAAIDALRERRVTALLATSVLQEGVSIPEVDLVINYGVATSAIIRLQSSGRTGRMRPGKVVHLILEHDLDRMVFFPVHNKTKGMHEMFRSEIDPEGNWTGQLSLFMK